MSPPARLAGHVEALKEELKWAQRSTVSEQIDECLRARVMARFAQDIQGQLVALDQLRHEIGDKTPQRAHWAKFRSIKSECSDLSQDCLAFVQGALSRSAGLDNGLCVIADAMLDQLAATSDVGWARLTVIGDAEDIADRTDIVRLRFPDVSLWSLPVVAHEFGHLVASDLNYKSGGRRRFPVDDFLRSQPETSRSHAEELFADLYATYTVGPALAMACALLRFDPSGSPFIDGERHPSAAKRIWFMVNGMRRIDPFYDAIALDLEEEWQAATMEAGNSRELAPLERDQLEGWLEKMLEMLSRRQQASAYQGWGRVGRIAEEVLAEDHPADLRPEDGLFDVLNGAWLARFRRPTKTDYLATRALNLLVGLARS